ncbi:MULTISPECIES: CoA transferase [unclassified Chelatococcus]|uniref:CaiB/BaiF CoA transferase family protein n=1 Tax=unclassified Chelatococcus TaxID=2638111 RepID=UPI001BCE6576|nr:MULTISPECIES: CoA transferase [unclassified Chelatococcus]MBS7697464.1 CoA transferase [Chelatococcus sp. YT9]MBX3560028.1 CoA transferase [Chelatococcus sp.]
MNGPLTGLKVLDLTRVLAGPLCTMMLGDMGAEVIKVESPLGDETRGWGPPHAGGEAAYYLGVNRNKRSIVLDLKTDEGIEILDRMMRNADILVENYKVGTLERWGFGEDWRRASVPRQIRCSITGYGPTGPRAADPGYDFILQAETGLMAITGAVDGEAMKHGVAIVDITTGLYATIAILSALRAREITGYGQAVTASLYETGISLLANVASNHLLSGKQASRFGNGHPNIVPYRTFRTNDGEIALAVGNDSQFERLSVLAEQPEWAADPRMKTNAARVRNRELVDSTVGEAMKGHSSEWWMAQLKLSGIPCGKVNSVADALKHPHTIARDMVVSLEHPTAGSLDLLGFPFKLTETPQTLRAAPPLLGEHTDEILAELGYDADSRRKLYQLGAAVTAGAEEQVSA